MPDVLNRFVDCHVFRRVEDRVEWLSLLRAPHCIIPDTWQMVQGAVEPGETAWEAALRELYEETGLVPKHLFTASHVNQFYLPESDQICLSPTFCAEVEPHHEIRLNEEHTEFRWVDLETALSHLPWPGQREGLRTCEVQFVHNDPRKESHIPFDRS